LCFPPFTDVLDDGGFGVPETDGAGTSTKGENGDPVDATTPKGEGGCSISGRPRSTAGDALAWCVALGAALALGRRARRRV
jgi:hypothetical protein